MKQPQQEQENRPRQAGEEEEEEVMALRWRQYPGPETDSAKNGIGKRGGGKLEGTDESTERTLRTGDVYGEGEEVEIIEEIEEELDVEGVLRKQNTHDLLCPNCNSCITRTVILRRRRKPKLHGKPKPAGNQFDEPTEADGEVITDPNSCATPTPAPDEQDKDEKREEAIKCLSCFSFCIPKGSGFWICPAPKESQVIESTQIPEEDQIPSDRTKCWLFGIFTSVKRETPVEQGDDLEAGPVETTDSNGIAGTAVVTYAIASEPRGLEILKSIVYGGLIESITSLGVVSSAAGGGASTLNILALGLANLISGLIILIHSLSDMKNDRSGAGGVISETGTQEDRYQELLGRRENFCLHTTVSILSYLIFGLVPPVVYGFSFRQSNDTDLKLAAVVAASFVCIILLAVGKAYVGKPQRSYFRTVLFYVIAGFSASGVSFLVGELVRKLLEKLGWFESSSDLVMPLLEAKPFEGAWASF